MSGFYKKNTDNTLSHAPNFVYTPNISMRKEDKDRAEEKDGWKWFDFEDDAYTYFGADRPAEEVAIFKARVILESAGIIEIPEFTSGALNEKWVKIPTDTAESFYKDISDSLLVNYPLTSQLPLDKSRGLNS